MKLDNDHQMRTSKFFLVLKVKTLALVSLCKKKKADQLKSNYVHQMMKVIEK